MSEWSLSQVFFCALRLSSRLNKANLGFPRNIETLVDYVKEHLETTRSKYIPINIHPRDYEASAFLGTIEISANAVDIFYDRDRNKCWRRFSVTKELCHVLYDTPNSQHLSSTPEQIESLLTQILAGLAEVDFKDHAASSEQATILMAIEILLPHSERANVNKMMSEGANARTVAEHYLLPEQMVSAYLDRNYASVMDKTVRDFQATESK